MKFIKSQDKSWLDKQGYSKKIFLDEKDLGQPGILVQQLKIKPGETADNHYHKKQTEIFYFLNTNGYFVVNGEKIVPQVGDIIVVEPNDIHTTTNDTNEDFLYVAFKYNYSTDDFYWSK